MFFYNKIDIYISTSLSDGGLASSIAEAMSFERLIIISNNSDNKIWIKNNINGFYLIQETIEVYQN